MGSNDGGMKRVQQADSTMQDTLKSQMPKTSSGPDGKTLKEPAWMKALGEYYIRPYTFDFAGKVAIGRKIGDSTSTRMERTGEVVAEAAKKAFDLASALGFVDESYKRLYRRDQGSLPLDQIALVNELTIAIFFNRGTIAGEYRKALGDAGDIKEALKNLEGLPFKPKVTGEPVGPMLKKVGEAKD